MIAKDDRQKEPHHVPYKFCPRNRCKRVLANEIVISESSSKLNWASNNRLITTATGKTKDIKLTNNTERRLQYEKKPHAEQAVVMSYLWIANLNCRNLQASEFDGGNRAANEHIKTF